LACSLAMILLTDEDSGWRESVDCMVYAYRSQVTHLLVTMDLDAQSCREELDLFSPQSVLHLYSAEHSIDNELILG